MRQMDPGNVEDNQFEEEPRYAVRLPFLIHLIALPVSLALGLWLLWTPVWIGGIALLAFSSLSILRAIRSIFCARRC